MRLTAFAFWCWVHTCVCHRQWHKVWDKVYLAEHTSC